MDEAAGKVPGRMVGVLEGEGLVEVSIRTEEGLATPQFVIWLRPFPPPPLVSLVAEGPASIVVPIAIFRTNVLLQRGTSVYIQNDQLYS